jgi:hypothetical protein
MEFSSTTQLKNFIIMVKGWTITGRGIPDGKLGGKLQRQIAGFSQTAVFRTRNGLVADKFRIVLTL